MNTSKRQIDTINITRQLVIVLLVVSIALVSYLGLYISTVDRGRSSAKNNVNIEITNLFGNKPIVDTYEGSSCHFHRSITNWIGTRECVFVVNQYYLFDGNNDQVEMYLSKLLKDNGWLVLYGASTKQNGFDPQGHLDSVSNRNTGNSNIYAYSLNVRVMNAKDITKDKDLADSRYLSSRQQLLSALKSGNKSAVMIQMKLRYDT